jgi:hypothetical protein
MALAQSGQEHFHQNANDGPSLRAASAEAEEEGEYSTEQAIDTLIQAVRNFLPLITKR